MTFGIDGTEPYEEDGWVGSEVRVGDALVKVAGSRRPVRRHHP